MIDCFGHPVESYHEDQIEAVLHYKVVGFDVLYGSSQLRDRVWEPYD